MGNGQNGRKLRIALACFALLAFQFSTFTSCANRLTPQGGPVDSLPPMAVNATPENGVRHFSVKRIFIEFNEYVQLKDQSKEFFTSPIMKHKPVVVIREKGVRIDIKDTLEVDQTYSLNFGNSIVDNNEGNPLAGFRYVFSTGSALDSMLTTGYTVDAARGDSISKAFVYFYDARRDTIPGPDSTLLKFKPQVVGRGQNNGIFIAQNLKDIDYKVYAFEDKNSNQLYDMGVDKVGFLDGYINPAHLEPIAIWLDEYRHYPTADPQTYMRLFMEEPARRQNLAASERTEKHRVELRFSAPWPQIDTLTFEGVSADSVIREYVTVDRDTMALWLHAAVGDTLKGRISYLRTDSLGNLVPEGKNLALVWRKVETREEEREREREEKDRKKAQEDGEEYVAPEKPNPFRFKVDASANINPEKSIPIEFGMPLVAVDSARISLSASPVEVKLGASREEEAEPVRTPVPFRIERDTMNIRLWTIRADWDETMRYRLIIDQGVFENVAGERNDSLGADFSIMPQSDFATLNLNIAGSTPSAKYIVRIVSETDQLIREMKNVVSGDYTLHYIPDGGVRLRITEDMNGNGKWDSGSLIERRQPERTELYVGPTGDALIPTRPNWEADVTVDMTRIFAPVSIEKIRADLQRAEEIRVAKYLEEKAKKEAERRQEEESGGTNGAGGMGIGGAMGGMRNQIQSTTR